MIAGRERDAFEALSEVLRPRLTSMCASIVGREAAEDVVQDAYLRMWSARARFDRRRGTFADWAATIARNAAYDHHRLRARREDLRRALVADHHDPSGSTCHDAAISAEARREVRAAAGGLRPEQRSALFDAFWLDHTHTDIADRSGVALGTVKGRVRLGMVAMRRELQAVADGHESAVEAAEAARTGTPVPAVGGRMSGP